MHWHILYYYCPAESRVIIIRYARTLLYIKEEFSSLKIGLFVAIQMRNLRVSERIIYGLANEQLSTTLNEQLLAYPSEL